MYDGISQQTAMSVKHSRNPHSSTLYDCSRKLQKCFVGTYTLSYREFRIQCQKHVLLCQQVSSECLECDKHLTFVRPALASAQVSPGKLTMNFNVVHIHTLNLFVLGASVGHSSTTIKVRGFNT
jgi:hypothetical protein